MARSILDIVIKLSKQGGADRETIKGLVQVKSAVSQVAMVAGGMTAALFAAKKAFDFGKEGAQLQFVEQRFNRLGESIGANSGLLGSLRDVTRGLYSDTQLMASASDLMGLGLAKSTDELLRLSKVSAGLNMNMNQLVLTLTNQTTMRFDALGVSVDGFKEKVKELEDAGMDASDAFKEAFLQQAEMQLDKVGEAADSTAGSFMRFEAGLKNALDEAKKAAGEGLEPLVRALADFMENEAKANAEVKVHNSLIEVSKQAHRDLTGQVNVSTAQASAFAHQLELATEYDQRWISVLQQNAATLTEAAAAGDAFGMSLDTVSTIISGPITKAQEGYQKQLADLQDDLADLHEQEARWTAPPKGSRKYDELQDKIGEVEQKIKDTTAAYQEQARQIMFNMGQAQILASTMSADQQAQAVAIMGQSMGMWDEKTASAITHTTEWVALLETGAITADQFAIRMGQMGENTFGVGLSAEEAIGPVVALTGASQTLAHDGFGPIEQTAPLAVDGISNVGSGLKDTRAAAQTAHEKLENVSSQMQKMDGMQAEVTLNIRVNGSLPNLGNYNRVRNNAGFLAGGGRMLDDMVVVGEKGFEIAVKDQSGGYTVIPHEASRELARLGLLDNARAMAAGGRMGQSVEPVRVTQAAAMQATRTDNTQPLGNAEMVTLLRGIDANLQRQEMTLVNAFKVAMQQVNP